MGTSCSVVKDDNKVGLVVLLLMGQDGSSAEDGEV